jgi:hypothetical protein
MNFPLKTWFKARKYFKFPDIKFRIFRSNKLFEFEFNDVMWKDKWGPRHESNPFISLTILSYTLYIDFGKYRIDPEFGDKEDASMEYWEYILDYVYYNNTKLTLNNWQYSSKIYRDKDGSKAWIPIFLTTICLNKRGLKRAKETYEQRGNTKDD